ncbi:MAG TPA: flagellar basal body-associated FliL family protein [Patescibacteria group bacterium]|nr:flagellar basal body-associated FliL family protein [Patescibacteria group bacterium]
MAEEQEVHEEEAPKKSGMSTVMLIGIIAGVVLLQVVIVFVIFKVFVSPSDTAEKKKEKKADTEEVAEEVSDEEESEEETPTRRVREVKEIVGTEDMILNPRGSSSRYIMVSLGLEVDDKEAVKLIEDKLTIPIQHTTRMFISQYSVVDLERTSLVDSLPGQLRKKLQPYFGEHKLRNVYFKKFIIQ